MSEKKIRNQIMNELGKDPCLLVFSNPSGVAEYIEEETGKKYTVSYGLGGSPGGPDLIVLIHWKHASGQRGCQTLGIEVKRAGEKLRGNQETWKRAAGMRGMVVMRCESKEEGAAFVKHQKHMLERIGLIPTRAEPAIYSIPSSWPG